MSFMKNFENSNNITATTNGDVAYKSTFHKNLDLFGLMGALRGEPDRIKPLFMDALAEDKLVALKNLFYLRDIRGGMGERENFRVLLKVLRDFDVDSLINILPFVSEFGRWDDVLELAYIEPVNMKNKNHIMVQKAVVLLVNEQIKRDMKLMTKNKPISLLAKWMPSINTSSHETRKRGRFWSTVLFKGDKKRYRKVLSELRTYLDVIEKRLSNNDFVFDYNKIPAGALRKYVNTFLSKDKDRYESWKESLKKDSSKLSQKVDKLFPYEIIRTLDTDQELAESMWSALPKNTTDKKILVVRDGSGSMACGSSYITPMEIATSLAIYTSERLTGAFKDKFITFSDSPKLIDLFGYETLESKVDRVNFEHDIANTDIEKTYNLIFEASKKANPEDYLDVVLIISDMQFDHGTDFSKSTYQAMKEKFEAANIPFPKMVYWNVNASYATFPTTDIENAQFVSGFSKNILTDIINGNDLNAVNLMLKTLEKYDFLDEYIK